MAIIHGYWPLGNNGLDLSSGGGHPVSSFNGSTTTVLTGPFANKGSRLISGGTSDYIDCGQGNSLRPASTISFWIKWINFQTGADGGYAHNIISRRDASAVDGSFYIYYIDSRGGSPANTISFGFRNSSTWYLKRSSALSLIEDRWYHVALTFDLLSSAAGSAMFYLDGNPVGVGTNEAAAAWTQSPASTNLRFGYSANAASNFNGRLSEVAIIGRILTPVEISNYYKSCVASPVARLALTPPFLGYPELVAEAATAADSISAYLSTKWATLVEAATAADVVAIRNTHHHPSVTESATATDSVDLYHASKNRHITETALASDVLSARVSTFWPTVTETAHAADAISGSFVFYRSVVEEALASDTTIGRIPKEAVVLETGLATDALAFHHTYVSTSKSGIYKLYINSVIRTTLFIKYRQDYDCTEKVFCAPETSTYTVWQTVRQSYRQSYGIEMVHVPVNYRQNYDLAVTAIFRRNWNGGLQAFAYNIREPFSFNSAQFYNVTERTEVRISQREYYTVRLNDNYTENVSYAYKVMLDGLDYTGKVKSLTFNYSLSQYTGECSVVWVDPQMYSQLDPLTGMGTARVEIYTGHYGSNLVLQGRFLIEKRSTEIDASKAYPTTWGRTITARLASPHSLPITKTWMYDTRALSIALEIMQLSDPSIQLNWQVTDYDVLGGNFVAAGEEPMTLLTKLAEPLGAIVTTNKLGEVVVRYQYV